MKHIPDSKITDAKKHLHAAKDSLKSAAQDKVAGSADSIGEKVKDGIDSLVERATPDHKS